MDIISIVLQWIDPTIAFMALSGILAGTLVVILVLWNRSRSASEEDATVDQDDDKEGTPWLENVLLFLPRAFIEMLDMVHTKRFKYYGLVIALLSIEAFFAFRASAVYWHALYSYINVIELAIISVIIFVAIFLCGYMIATHQPGMGAPSAKEEDEEEETQTQPPAPVEHVLKRSFLGFKWEKVVYIIPPHSQEKSKKIIKPRWKFGQLATAGLVLLHDWAGTFYMSYSSSTNEKETTAALQIIQAAQAQTQGTFERAMSFLMQADWLKFFLTIGMCAIGFLPFIMGKWAEELRPQMAEELEREVDEFTDAATRKIKRRAVNRVLRRVGRTDVVQLVQALPKDEFNTFKSFVMPIIAPGKPVNKEERETLLSELDKMRESKLSGNNEETGQETFSEQLGNFGGNNLGVGEETFRFPHSEQTGNSEETFQFPGGEQVGNYQETKEFPNSEQVGNFSGNFEETQWFPDGEQSGNFSVNNSGNYQSTQKFPGSQLFSEQVGNSGVNNQETSKRRNTQPLSELSRKPERTTDELKAVNRRASGSGSDKGNKVRQLLKKYPDWLDSKIAEKAGVSKGYVSKIKNQKEEKISVSS